MTIIYALVLGVLLAPMMAWAQTNTGEAGGEDADGRRFKEIMAKHSRGEDVTPEEQQFAKTYAAQHNQEGKSAAKAKGGRPAKAAKARPASKPASGSAPASAPQLGEWEQFPDGSTGRVMDYAGAGGVTIAGYLRKPAGPGPFPVVVALHGGGHFPNATYGMGKSTKH
ncbi:MAG: hypothetical protein NTW86_31470, partial [Candidatus Sumerlaeota bacterium]|nr:hypothetical protein [Candidatus Sumerlaeota bacterium]